MIWACNVSMLNLAWLRNVSMPYPLDGSILYLRDVCIISIEHKSFWCLFDVKTLHVRTVKSWQSTKAASHPQSTHLSDARWRHKNCLSLRSKCHPRGALLAAVAFATCSAHRLQQEKMWSICWKEWCRWNLWIGCQTEITETFELGCWQDLRNDCQTVVPENSQHACCRDLQCDCQTVAPANPHFQYKTCRILFPNLKSASAVRAFFC